MPTLVPKVSMETFTTEDGLKVHFDRESAKSISLRSTAVNLRESTGSPLHPLGSVAVVGASEYRYAKSGAAINCGEVVRNNLSSYTKKNGFLDGAATKGSRRIKIKYDDSAITADAYQHFLDGLGHIYWIVSHDALADGDKGEMVLGEELVEEIPASTNVSLIGNPYQDVRRHNINETTTPGHAILGVSMADAATGHYFWLQVRGVATVRIQEAVAKGVVVLADTTGEVTGLAVSALLNIGPQFSNKIGRSLDSGTSANDWIPVLLEL